MTGDRHDQLADRLEAEGWSSAIRILCPRAGPTCECGAYEYRTRPAGTVARPHLVRLRCEACGRLALVDLDDPGAELADVDGAPVTMEQGALF